MRKRILMMILSACLVVTSTPMTAFGADIDANTIDSLSSNDGVENIIAEEESVSDNEAIPEEGGVSDNEVAPEEGGVSDNEVTPEEGGVSDNEVAPEEGGVSDNEVAPEEGGVSDNEVIPEEEGISGNTVSENETLSDKALTLSANDTVSMNDLKHGFMTEEEYREALQALEELSAKKTIMALVYLSDYYTVRKEAALDSEPVVTVPSGQQVHIIGFEVTENAVWYQVKVEYNGALYEGYIDREHLAYSDEELLAWEEAYLSESMSRLPMTYETSSTYYADVESFPVSYQSALRKLKQEHPNWTFVKMNTGLDWNACINEQYGDYSWIWHTAKDSFKGAAINSQWHYATKEAIAYYMDPRNFLNETYIFQFEQNSFNKSYHTTDALDIYLSGSFMDGVVPDDSQKRTYSEVFYEVGAGRGTTGISPFFLAAKAMLEQGRDGSPLVFGTYPGYEGLYNFFNIGATGTDATAIINGLTYARKREWTTRYKSIAGGATEYGNGYILIGQDTLYLQKFDLLKAKGYLHQYQQNIMAPSTDGKSVKSMYANAGALNSAFVFKIPVFHNMPNEIKINKTKMTLNKEAQGTLYLTYNGTKIDNSTIIWTSSDDAIASVDAQGVVTAKAVGPINEDGTAHEVGTAVITAKWGDLTAKCTITVKAPLQKITLDKAAVTIVRGRTSTLTVIRHPEDTTDDIPVSWTTSNAKVATIKDGVITAVGNGNAKITAKVGTKTAVCQVSVVTPLEQVVLSDSDLQLAEGDTRILEVSFEPVDTTDEKSVVWSSLDDSIVSVEPLVGGTKARITAKAIGTTTIKAVSTVTNSIEAVCKVTVGNPIQNIWFAQETVEMQEGERQSVSFHISPITAEIEGVTLTSVDTRVATVGTVTNHGDGTYTAEVEAVSAGTVLLKAKAGEISNICTVIVLPDETAEPDTDLPEEAYKLTPVTKQLQLQSYANHPADSAVLQVQNQYKEILSADLFTYTSANTDIVRVNDVGVITVNPDYIAKTNKTVNVTAALKDDEAGRKVTVKVTVLAGEQVSNIIIKASEDALPENAVETEHLTQVYQEGMQFTLFHESRSVAGTPMNTKVKWSVSDTSMATVKVNAQGAAVVTVRKPGAFKVTCTAQDTFKESESVDITTLSATPILENGTVTFNKKSDAPKTSSFGLVPMNGAAVKNVTIESVLLGRKAVEDSSRISIVNNADGTYYVAFPDEVYANALAKGTYTIQLKVTTDGFSEEVPEETIEHTLKLTLKVTDAAPKVTVKASTINLFYTDEASRTIVAPVTANGSITAMTLEDTAGNGIDDYIRVTQKGGTWYFTFEDEVGTYTASSIKGKIHVTVDGYESVGKTITVKTPVKKPTIVQSAVPVVDRNLNQSVIVSLQNKTLKQSISDFAIISETASYVKSEVNTNGELEVSIPTSTAWKNGQTYSTKLRIQDDNWKQPLDVTVKLKSYTAVPKVTLKASTLTLNMHEAARMESAYTTMGTDRENTSILPSGEWKVMKYDTATKKYVVCDDASWVQFYYRAKDSTLHAKFSEQVQSGETVVDKGVYKFRLSRVIDGYRSVYKDVSIKVIDTAPTATIRVSGKLDLVNRENATLKGTITLKNVTGQIESVSLLNEEQTGLHKDYYALMCGTNTFFIKAKANARLQTKSITIPVKVTLHGGTIIDTKVTFKPTQSVPKITVPVAQTIYKSGAVSEKEYDMTEKLASGIHISSMEAVSVPNGFAVAIEAGTVKVTLKDKSIKPGTYNIKIAIYFKGAQYVAGYPNGKPVTKTIQVKIK